MIIPPVILIIALGITYAISLLLSIIGKVWDRRRKGLNRLTKNGRLVLAISVVTIFIYILEYYNNQKILNKEKTELSLEREIRDSLIEIGIREGVQEEVNKIGSMMLVAFENQGFKLDTIREDIIKDISENPTINNYINEPEPMIFLLGSSISIVGDSHFKLDIRIQNSAINDVNLDIYIIARKVNQEVEFKQADAVLLGQKYPAGKLLTNIWISPKDVDALFVYLKGSYKNLSGTKKYILDDIYYYKKNRGTTTQVVDTAKVNLKREFIKRIENSKKSLN